MTMAPTQARPTPNSVSMDDVLELYTSRSTEKRVYDNTDAAIAVVLVLAQGSTGEYDNGNDIV